MKIAFLQSLMHEQVNFMVLAATLRGTPHECQVFIEEASPNLVDEVAAWKPDLIGFSCTTGTQTWALQTAAAIKRAISCQCIVGGPHPTFFPELIECDHIDIISRGESEAAFRELVDALSDGRDISRIANLWVKQGSTIHKNRPRALVSNLDELPTPDRTIYYEKFPTLRELGTKVFLTGRGCPYRCAFCYNGAYRKLYEGMGRYVRKRSVDAVIAEILAVKRRYPLEFVQFSDDTFVMNRKWLSEFGPRFKQEVGLPFLCGSRADLLTEDIVRVLSAAGCKVVTMGIESGNEHIRNTVYAKGVSSDKIIRAGRLLKKHKIQSRSTNILCGPDETLERAWETVAINIEAKIRYPITSLFQPYPGVHATTYAEQMGYLPEDFTFDSLSPIYALETVMDLPEKTEIVNLHRLFFWAVRFPSLHPPIRRMVRWRSPAAQKLIFGIGVLGFVFNYSGYRQLGIGRVLKLARGHLRNQLPKVVPGRTARTPSRV